MGGFFYAPKAFKLRNCDGMSIFVTKWLAG